MSEEVNKASNEKKKPEAKNALGSMVKPAEPEKAPQKQEATEESKDEEPNKNAKAEGKQEVKAKEQAPAKKKEFTGRTEEKVTHTVTFELTEEDFSNKGKEAAQLQGDLNKLEYEFQGVKEEYKAKTSLLEADCSRLLSIIRRGKEEREVECVKLIDFDAGLVEFWHKGKIVEKRGIKPEERQRSLFN